MRYRATGTLVFPNEVEDACVWCGRAVLPGRGWVVPVAHEFVTRCQDQDTCARIWAPLIALR